MGAPVEFQIKTPAVARASLNATPAPYFFVLFCVIFYRFFFFFIESKSPEIAFKRTVDVRQSAA